MCPLYPFHLVLLYLCLILPLLLAVVEGSEVLSDWKLSFNPNRISKLEEHNTTEVKVTYHPPDVSDDYLNNLQLVLRSENVDILSLEQDPSEEAVQELVFDLHQYNEAKNWTEVFNVSANFLGFTKVFAEIRRDSKVLAQKPMRVSVVRKKTIESKVFTFSVAALISLAYVNMGCALDLQIIKETLRRPVGPVIGFICQFLIMPLLSFALGFVFPSTESAMRLGLFVNGVSPGGGASNIWTLMFGGNLNLSITMTAISTFSSFFMMPLWLFTLGQLIFNETDVKIPYHKIVTYAFALVVPLTIGIAIARYLPRVSKFLVKILKPMAFFLILFIVIFGVFANLYIFKLMTWRVFVTGMALPWLGFGFGCLMAKLCRRSTEDIIAIAIETGIQNTGVAIFILWFTLDQPAGDMTAVIPVASATMTPIPLLMGLIVMKIRSCMYKKPEDKFEPCRVDEDIKECDSDQKLMANGNCNAVEHNERV